MRKFVDLLRIYLEEKTFRKNTNIDIPFGLFFRFKIQEYPFYIVSVPIYFPNFILTTSQLH
jgi:hypothetical protein